MSACGRANAPSAATPNSRREYIGPPSLLLQREREQRIAGPHHHVLAAVEQEGLRPVGGVGAEPGVPEGLAGGGLVGHEVAAPIVAEEESARRAEQPHGPAAGTPGAARERPA